MNSYLLQCRTIPLIVYVILLLALLWAPQSVRSFSNNNNNTPLSRYSLPPALSAIVPPPPTPLKSIPLPLKLAGGLFLFGTSVKSKDDKVLSKEILKAAEDVLRVDPLISMELGLGIEAGGIFASSSSKNSAVIVEQKKELSLGNDDDGDDNSDNGESESESESELVTIQMHQMIIEFQLNGGNSWAQARVHGIKYGTETNSPVQLISLGVANMDASLNGGWAEVTLPPPSPPTPPIIKII